MLQPDNACFLQSSFTLLIFQSGQQYLTIPSPTPWPCMEICL